MAEREVSASICKKAERVPTLDLPAQILEGADAAALGGLRLGGFRWKNLKTKGVRVAANWIREAASCTSMVRYTARCCDFRCSINRPSLGWVMLVLIWVMLVLIVLGIPAEADEPRPSGNASALEAGQERRAARGWLELEQDQRAYRDRVAPLDLKEQRQLEVIERSQQLGLRRLQQRNARQRDKLERQRRVTPPGNLDAYNVPKRDAAADIRRRAERHRSMIRSQQQGLPFRHQVR